MRQVESDPRGFSLIELMIVSSVSLFILGAGATLLYQGQIASTDRRLTADTQQEIRVAFMGRSQEIRMAGSGVPESLETIERAKPDALVFLADIDAGSASLPCTGETPAAPQPERIAYEVVSGDLQRQLFCRVGSKWVLESTGILVQRLDRSDKTPIFRYFDLAGVELGGGGGLSKTDRSNVATVEMGVAIRNGADTLAARQGDDGQRIAVRAVLRNVWATAHVPGNGGDNRGDANTTPVDTDPVIKPAYPVITPADPVMQ